ncbi:hypothetical protein BSU04_43175 [Caballeronia sordidicola]|uniref:Uncharacterized protein n=1 Tax=Caballeronia sordidicola TaxID=196367 RepID=A0A226WMT7_CABSO|nr:hypothetical protein BSU04_43175 [Caballeronia sordidicola]
MRGIHRLHLDMPGHRIPRDVVPYNVRLQEKLKGVQGD